MDRVFEAQLIECLSALEEGEPVEQILARYPEDAQRLRPVLQIAAALPGLAMEPRLKAQEVSLQRLLTTAQTLAPLKPKHGDARRPSWRLPILETLGVVILAISVSAMLFAISGSTLPGTPLYGLKRSVEGLRLVLTTQDDARGELKQQFNQERIDEIRTMLTQGSQSEVAFEGTIEFIQPDMWQISGLAVTIGSSTQIIGNPQVGLSAHVRGQVESSRLLAEEIVIEPITEPMPEPSVTYEPEGAPTSHPTLMPSPTATPTPTLIPQRTPTSTPTSTPITPSGATPTEEDDIHDNQDDADNQNSNENDNGDGNDNSGHDGDEGDD